MAMKCKKCGKESAPSWNPFYCDACCGTNNPTSKVPREKFLETLEAFTGRFRQNAVAAWDYRSKSALECDDVQIITDAFVSAFGSLTKWDINSALKLAREALTNVNAHAEAALLPDEITEFMNGEDMGKPPASEIAELIDQGMGIEDERARTALNGLLYAIDGLISDGDVKLDPRYLRDQGYLEIINNARLLLAKQSKV